MTKKKQKIEIPSVIIQQVELPTIVLASRKFLPEGGTISEISVSASAPTFNEAYAGSIDLAHRLGIKMKKGLK